MVLLVMLDTVYPGSVPKATLALGLFHATPKHCTQGAEGGEGSARHCQHFTHHLDACFTLVAQLISVTLFVVRHIVCLFSFAPLKRENICFS